MENEQKKSPVADILNLFIEDESEYEVTLNLNNE